MLTKDEFERRFQANYLIDGFGFDRMTIHSPCPFCAAPDFHVYKLDTMMAVMGKETVCKECGRGFRVDWQDEPSVTTGHFGQTSGDDPPDYITIPRARSR